MVSLVDEAKWAPMIGRLILAFGSIEHTTYQCIKAWSAPVTPKDLPRTKLSARLDLSLKLAAQQQVSPDARTRFAAEVEEARTLAKYRNLVAHSPLCLVLFQDGVDADFLEAIASSTDERHIVFEDLEAVVAKAEECAEGLGAASAMFRIEKLDFDALRTFPGLPPRDA